MKKILLATIFLLSLPVESFSSGFGWRASVVPWENLRTIRENGVSQAAELIKEQPSSEKLKLHFQIQLDNEINSRFCHPLERDGYQVTPRHAEFFPKNFLSWAAETQKKRGINSSFFLLFQQPPMFVKLSSDKKYEKRRDLWFVIEPQAIASYLAEVKDFNAKVKIPSDDLHLARYLEGVLLIADNDRFPGSNAEGGSGRSALFLCGHD